MYSLYHEDDKYKAEWDTVFQADYKEVLFLKRDCGTHFQGKLRQTSCVEENLSLFSCPLLYAGHHGSCFYTCDHNFYSINLE